MKNENTKIDSSLRCEAIKQLLNGAENAFSYDQVSKGLEEQGWEIHPIILNGKVVGAIIQKDNDIHTSISPEYQKRWNPRPYIKGILYPALDKYGVVKSEALKCDQRGIQWLSKLGFTVTREDEEKYYFELTNLKFKKIA